MGIANTALNANVSTSATYTGAQHQDKIDDEIKKFDYKGIRPRRDQSRREELVKMRQAPYVDIVTLDDVNIGCRYPYVTKAPKTVIITHQVPSNEETILKIKVIHRAKNRKEQDGENGFFLRRGRGTGAEEGTRLCSIVQPLPHIG